MKIERRKHMPDPLAKLREDVSVANRILANEGIIDAFGHISVRHPNDPKRYLISRHRAAELVEPDDVLEFTLDSQPVRPTSLRLYSELVIHGEIYKARPEVNSVCHHHSMSVLPYCATGVPIVPLYHLGAALGPKVPFWDSRDEFGDTNLLVRTPEEGASLARALGPYWLVLLRRHGATVAGKSLRETVYRSIFTSLNAELQSRATALGTLGPLSPGETERCGAYGVGERSLDRAYEYWTRRLQKAEAMWGRSAAASGPAKVAAKRSNAPANRAKASAKRGRRK
jgi:HCOMODA/2-hydroxy-3-carboxy-muconic semialdehyde decarboxylase